MSEFSLKNHLAKESSPYLLQHKDNPVHWFSWGSEAFAAAQELDRPIFLSIGYSTCYWCHVMEGDSFERDDVAAVLNQHFICIKVDREERPDIDKIYMEAVMAISGHGGWPLSAFLTPEGKPFFAATFFWRTQFIDILLKVSELWQKERDKFLNSAEEITAHLNRLNEGKQSLAGDLDRSSLDHFVKEAKRYFDQENGGFGQAPKFPQAERLLLLLNLAASSEDRECLKIVTDSLDAMVRGGLYDHIGGGFHRYSVDAEWLVPHFEKMLYDNALLARLYIEASRVTKNSSYKLIAAETLDYLLCEMHAPNGGFFSAQDAGEVGEEGEYYTWQREELLKLLKLEQREQFFSLYQNPANGNFEGRLIPRLIEGKQPIDKLSQQEIRKLLYRTRLTRKLPHRDEKILVDWNALAITAFAEGYRFFRDQRYLSAASQAANFICSTLFDDVRLKRSFCAEVVSHNGVLTDYAYLVEALLALYRATGELSWYEKAVTFQKIQDRLFWDSESGGYFYAESNPELESFSRSKDLADGAIPSGNAISLQNLVYLYHLNPSAELLSQANQILALSASDISLRPFNFAGLLIGLNLLTSKVKELVVVATEQEKELESLQLFLGENHLPNLVVAFSNGSIEAPPIVKNRTAAGDKITYYLCREGVCQIPLHSLAELKAALEQLGLKIP